MEIIEMKNRLSAKEKKELYFKFEKQLQALINKNNLECLSDTPDFVSSGFLVAIFKAYNKFIKKGNAGAFMVDAREIMYQAIENRKIFYDRAPRSERGLKAHGKI